MEHKQSFGSIKEIEDEAKKLVQDNGLTYWKITFNNNTRLVGWCDPRIKTISLSKKVFSLNLDNGFFITDTILHEIAHALDWVRNRNGGHGTSWKIICNELGVTPSSTVKRGSIVSVKGNYIYECPNCGNKSDYFRKPKNDKACYDCCTKYNGGKYSEEFKMGLIYSKK